MNYRQYNHEALPLTLPPVAAGVSATDIAGLKLADAAMLSFNSQLHGLREDAPSVGAAQVASLAGWLKALPAETAEATINLRMARAETLRRMLDDPDWSLPEDIAARGRQLLEYIQNLDDLIPDDVPLYGHLDDALMVELCWSRFAGEVQDYLDYCRFCSEEPGRGTPVERRSSWERNCLAEASALLHRQEIRERGYARVPRLIPFRVR